MSEDAKTTLVDALEALSRAVGRGVSRGTVTVTVTLPQLAFAQFAPAALEDKRVSMTEGVMFGVDAFGIQADGGCFVRVEMAKGERDDVHLRTNRERDRAYVEEGRAAQNLKAEYAKSNPPGVSMHTDVQGLHTTPDLPGGLLENMRRKHREIWDRDGGLFSGSYRVFTRAEVIRLIDSQMSMATAKDSPHGALLTLKSFIASAE